MLPTFERDKELEAKVMTDILRPAYPVRGELRQNWLKNSLYTSSLAGKQIETSHCVS